MLDIYDIVVFYERKQFLMKLLLIIIDLSSAAKAAYCDCPSAACRSENPFT